MVSIRKLGLLILFPVSHLCAQAPIEYRNLDGLNDPKRWEPAECEVSVSAHKAWNLPMMRMRILVDYQAGEKAYPIGWPRIYLNLNQKEQDWRDYDRLEFQLYAESSRDKLPQRPINFHLFNKQGEKKIISMTSAAIGTAVTFSFNVSDIGIPGEVTRVGFNINESDYNDKDLVDYHIGGFRLARASAAQVTEIKSVAPAIFCDSQVLPVEVVIEGPSEKLIEGIPFELCCGEYVAFNKTISVVRGRQTLYLSLGADKVEPGAYTLIAFPKKPELRKAIAITITSSPWK